MESNWQNQILRLKYRTTEAEDKRFVSLVYQMQNQCTLDVARVLMKTFTDEPDYGVQESVVDVLMSAEPEVYIQSLLEELPRLLADAPDWAEVLVGWAVNSEPARLVTVARNSGSHVVTMLARLLSNEAIIDLYPNASVVHKQLVDDANEVTS